MNFTPIEQLAILAGVSLRTVYRDVKAGVLRTQKIDGRTMIKDDGAARYVEQRKAIAEALARLGRAA
jgi:predicted site-specific integrase-resolvase